MARRVLVKRFPNGKWYWRRGSSSASPWNGPYETKHVAEKVRESKTGGAWGMPQASRRRYGNTGMTKKHFIAIAETLGAIRDKKKRAIETDRWIPTLKQENPRFDVGRFRGAVESIAAKHGNRRRSRYGNDGAPPVTTSAPAPAAGNRRKRGRGGRGHAKRNARTGRFTRRG